MKCLATQPRRGLYVHNLTQNPELLLFGHDPQSDCTRRNCAPHNPQSKPTIREHNPDSLLHFQLIAILCRLYLQAGCHQLQSQRSMQHHVHTTNRGWCLTSSCTRALGGTVEGPRTPEQVALGDLSSKDRRNGPTLGQVG